MSINEKTLQIHEKNRGKLSVELKIPLQSYEDLSLVYTPGVAEVSRKIAENKENSYKYTMKGNCVAVASNGSAVLGLGDIGVDAILPVAEGKCVLFKKFADIDAFPICIDTNNVDEFVEVMKKICAPFGGINLEDIAAPECFDIEQRLSDELDIPVFHDDQHGTAIVVLAALINALKVVGKLKKQIKVIVLGAGAAGVAVTELLLEYGIVNITVCDRKGVINYERADLQEIPYKLELAKKTNPNNDTGLLRDVIEDADVCIGVSGPELIDVEDIGRMASRPIVFALANPTPEIMPELAKKAGAEVVGTGRSDFPNQINNALAFPGIFRGMLNSRIKKVTPKMKIVAAEALGGLIKNPTSDKIIPEIFNSEVVPAISEAISNHHHEKK